MNKSPNTKSETAAHNSNYFSAPSTYFSEKA